MSITHELKRVTSLAWPLLIAQVTQTLMGVSDTIMAGRFSATDMAAVAIGFSITMPVLFFIQGLILALPPVISRFHGANQPDKVANATQQTAWMALSVALLACLATLAVPFLFSLMNIEDDLRNITVDYVRFILFSAPAFAVYQILRNYCEGLSVTKPTMLIMVLGLLVNIPANYIFIYGKLGAPAMGGAGCGLATMLVFISMALASGWYARTTPRLQAFALFNAFHLPDMAQMVRAFKAGLPIAMTILFEVTLFGVVALLLSPFGATTVAAHQVALNFSSLMFMLPLSIGMAISIRIGNLLGQDSPQEAKLAVYGALILGLSIATITAVLTVVARNLIPTLYTSEVPVIEMAASLMLLAAMFQLSDAVQVISVGALRGYKDSRAMFYLTFVSYWLVGLPIGCILALTDWVVPSMGAAGFWIGFICGLTCAAILLGVRLTIVQRRLQPQG